MKIQTKLSKTFHGAFKLKINNNKLFFGIFQKRRSKNVWNPKNCFYIGMCIYFYHGSLAQGNSKYIILNIEKSRLLLLAIASKFLYFENIFIFLIILFYICCFV